MWDDGTHSGSHALITLYRPVHYIRALITLYRLITLYKACFQQLSNWALHNSSFSLCNGQLERAAGTQLRIRLVSHLSMH